MSTFTELAAGPLLSPLTVLVAAIVLAATAYFTLTNHALAPIKGPLTAKWSRLWILYHARKGDLHRVMIDLHREHGSLVRTGPKEVSVSDPSAVRAIYSAGSKFRKSDWYSVWQGRRTFDLFAERNEGIHGAQRRLVSAIYSLDSLLKLESHVDDSLSFLLARLSEKEGEVINMNLWAQLFAFDVVGAVTFSKRFGFMEAGNDKGVFAQIDSALRSASWVGQIPWLYWAQDWLDPLIGNHLGIRARHGTLRTLAVNAVQSRKQEVERGEESGHSDILARLMQVQREKPEAMDDTGVVSMATSNIFAGSDTTAISIGAVLFYLCQNPACREKLLEEIGSVLGSRAPRDTIAYEAASRMKYLQACIYEALRLHPAVGMSLPRVVPDAGLRVGDVYIPSGTTVGVNPWVLHRNQEIFGEDADSFRPERWLSDRSQLDKDRFFFAFGAGSRMCLGRNLSWIEISKLIPLLLLNFDLELAHTAESVTENCWWFVKLEGLDMKLKRKERLS